MLFSSTFIELMSFVVSTSNTSIPYSPQSLLHVTTAMGTISKRFFVSNVTSKVPITLITVSPNCFNWRLLFLNFGLPIFSQKFLGIKANITCSINMRVKKYAIQLYFISGLGRCIYCIYFDIFCWITFAFYPFFSFVIAYHLKTIFLFTIWTYFSQGWTFILLSIMFFARVFEFGHEFGYVDSF